MMENKETVNTAKPRLDTNTPPRPEDIDRIQESGIQTGRSKVTNWAMIGALIIITLGLLRILVWSLDNSPVLEIKNSPFPTRTIREHPTAGGVIFLDTDYCKHRDIEGELQISFVSASRVVFLPESQESSEKGCFRREITIVIPKDIPPDTYAIKFRATYDKNPLKQNETTEFESLPVVIGPM